MPWVGCVGGSSEHLMERVENRSDRWGFSPGEHARQVNRWFEILLCFFPPTWEHNGFYTIFGFVSDNRQISNGLKPESSFLGVVETSFWMGEKENSLSSVQSHWLKKTKENLEVIWKWLSTAKRARLLNSYSGGRTCKSNLELHVGTYFGIGVKSIT